VLRFFCLLANWIYSTNFLPSIFVSMLWMEEEVFLRKKGDKFMNMSFWKSRFFLVFSIICSLGLSAKAAAIAWDAPIYVSDSGTDVIHDGGRWAAEKMAGDARGIEGVSFHQKGADGKIFYSSSFSYAGEIICSASCVPSVSDAYRSLLEGVSWMANGATYLITLNGLTPGTSYKVQIWSSSEGAPNSTVRWSDASEDGNEVILQVNDGSGGRTLGQFVVGTFVAPSNGVQQIYGFGTDAFLNGIMVRDLSLPDGTGDEDDIPPLPIPGPAAVEWSGPYNIFNDMDVVIDGLPIAAEHMGVDADVTVNGVHFLNPGTSGIFSFSGIANQYSGEIVCARGKVSPSYTKLLEGVSWDSKNLYSLLAISNLEFGATYKVQVWYQTSFDTRKEIIFSVDEDSGATNSVLLCCNTGNQLGQYVLGTFTACDSVQKFLISTNGIANAGGVPTLNAIQIRRIFPDSGDSIPPFVPDNSFVDKDGYLCLLSRSNKKIFRWDTFLQQYTNSISLSDIPLYAAYSEENHAIYTAYQSGSIFGIDLSDTNFAETAFADLPSALGGLSTAGSYVFASDHSGSWWTHYTFFADGSRVSAVDRNYRSDEYIWSDANQKMYFFRDDISPNDLLWEQINADGESYPSKQPGAIGAKKDSPLHSSVGFNHPIRVAPDGSIVVLGSGVIHDAETLARRSEKLTNSVVDVAWLGNDIYTVRTVDGATQYQRWSYPTFENDFSTNYPGKANRLISIDGGQFVSVSISSNGVPLIRVLNSQLEEMKPGLGALKLQVLTEVNEGDGVLSNAVRLSISPVSISNVVVGLSTVEGAEFSVPSQVTIPAGQKSVDFDLTVLDDAVLDGSISAVLQGSNVCYKPACTTITVHDNETATLTLSLPETTFEGAGTLAGALMIDPAPDRDVLVELKSNNPSKISGCNLLLSAGQTMIPFTLDVMDDDLIDGMQTATISAQVQNWLGSQTSVFIFDNETTALDIQLPASVMEGEGILPDAGKIVLSGKATSDLRVILTSSDRTEIAVPAYVIISNGTSSASFDLSVQDDEEIDGLQSPSVTAQMPGFVPDVAYIDVQDNDLYALTVEGIPTNQPVLEATPVEVVAVNIDGMPLTWFTGSVSLVASDDAGQIDLSPADTPDFVSGKWTGDVVFSNVANCVVLVADDGVGHTGTSSVFNVTGSLLVLSPDTLTNSVVVAGNEQVYELIVSNAGNRDLEFSFQGIPEDISSKNLIVNGDFEEGNTGFSSGYIYTPDHSSPSPDSGKYGIGDDPKAWHSGLFAMNDHTSTTGKMWMANGDLVPNTLWEQSVDVQKGNVYEFEAWAALLYKDPAQFEFFVDGTSIGKLDVINSGGWLQFSQEWRALHSGTVTLSIRNISSGMLEAYAIDDLSFSVKKKPSGLIAYFPFNANANDESGNGHDGAVNGATLTTDRFGNAESAYHFDGTDDHISIPDSDQFTVSNVTIAVWMKTTDKSDAKHIFSDYASGYDAEWYNLYLTANSGWIRWAADPGGNVTVPVAVGTTDLSDGEWHFVVGVRDTASKQLKVYVDGVLEKMATDKYASVLNPNADFWIGGQNGFSKRFFNGDIDDLSIYNRALSEAEILELYQLSEDPKEGWITLTPKHGILAPGSNVSVSVRLDASSFVAGDCSNAVLTVKSNDAFSPSKDLSVSMWVVPAAPTMMPEPAFTEGAENEVSWSLEEGATSYLVEVSSDTNTVAWEQSGWIGVTNYTFSNLPINKTCFYRVKAAASGNCGLLESAWSDWVWSKQMISTVDMDADFMPNWWEDRYFGGITNASATKDADGDGQSNLDEFIAGMNPTNSDSFFRVQAFNSPSNGVFVLNWDVVTGRVYSIYWKSNLTNAFQVLETGIHSPQNSYTDSLHHAESQGFYWIDVKLEK